MNGDEMVSVTKPFQTLPLQSLQSSTSDVRNGEVSLTFHTAAHESPVYDAVTVYHLERIGTRETMTQPAGNGFDRGKWFYNHPKVAELRQSGITDSDLIFLTITVYIHLIEGCNWFDVKLHPFPHLQKVLISGYKRRECPVKELVLPIRSGYQFQPESLSILMNTREFHSLTDQKNLNVAIVSGSSKVVFYKVSDDLVPPVTPN